jgi:hypothetical protein
MKIYNYSEARQNFSTVLNTALKEEVIITRKDGSKLTSPWMIFLKQYGMAGKEEDRVRSSQRL